MKKIGESCFRDDIDMSELNVQLPLLHDIIKKAIPEVRIVTSIHTICDAMDSNEVFKERLPAIHNLLRLCLTIPITSATAERTFSALKQVFTYLRSTMTEQRLNNCLLLHVHKKLTDELNLVSVAREFVARNEERIKYFGNY